MFSNRLSDRISLLGTLPQFPFYILIRYKTRYKSFAIFLLILVISISPRIHMGTLQYGKLLDFRYEDFLIIILAFPGFIYSIFGRQKLYISPLGKPILLYLFLAFVSTLIGLFFGWIELTRAFFFYFKEVEYFLMFFITVNFIKDYKGVKLAISAFLIGGLANGFYVLYRYLTHNIGYIETELTYGYYGIPMIGESGPGVTGTYFSMILIFSVGSLAFIPNKTAKLISMICIVLSFSGIIGSLSRGTIVALIITLPIFLYFIIFSKQLKWARTKRIAVLGSFIVCIYFSGSVFYGQINKSTLFAQRINISDSKNVLDIYTQDRVKGVYTDYFKVISKSPIIGLGKSITGQQDLPGIVFNHFYGEAHNNYIRILVEMGIIGLLSFLYLFYLILKFSYIVFRDGSHYFSNFMGLVCLNCTLLFLVASMGGDIFVTARPIELFWILVGLLMVVCRQSKAFSIYTCNYIAVGSENKTK